MPCARGDLNSNSWNWVVNARGQMEKKSNKCISPITKLKKNQTQMRLPLLGTAASPAVHEITEADLAPINLMYYLPSNNYELY